MLAIRRKVPSIPCSLFPIPYLWLVGCVATAAWCACLAPAYAGVAYELDGKVVVTGWSSAHRSLPIGEAPALSPGKDMVAYLRDGNVFMLRKKAAKEVLISHDPLAPHSELLLNQRVSWHPSGEWLVYTRALPCVCAKKALRMLKPGKASPNQAYVHTIWIANLRLKRSRQIINPMGNFAKLGATDQPEGASVYEPMFSPDGKSIWFLNGGSLYEAAVDLSSYSIKGRYRLVARIGSGLDLTSDGASKAGSGAQRMVWDAKHNRLCYWIGRFWGSGFSEFGYISWNRGKWGKPTKWNPTLAASIREDSDYLNVSSFAFDDKGKTWVTAFFADQFRWVRQDGKSMLPIGANQPDWGLAR